MRSKNGSDPQASRVPLNIRWIRSRVSCSDLLCQMILLICARKSARCCATLDDKGRIQNYGKEPRPVLSGRGCSRAHFLGPPLDGCQVKPCDDVPRNWQSFGHPQFCRTGVFRRPRNDSVVCAQGDIFAAHGLFDGILCETGTKGQHNLYRTLPVAKFCETKLSFVLRVYIYIVNINMEINYHCLKIKHIQKRVLGKKFLSGKKFTAWRCCLLQ